MADSIFPSTGAIGDYVGGAPTTSILSNDLNSSVGLPSGTTASNSIDLGTGSSWSPGSWWDILTDQSSMGVVQGNPTSADSAIGVSQGTSNTNTYENPGGTQSNNPGSPSGSGTGNGSTLLSSLEKYKYDIFAVVLGIIFVIIGAAQMARVSGMPAVPV
jgi:hypothetical protein